MARGFSKLKRLISKKSVNAGNAAAADVRSPTPVVDERDDGNAKQSPTDGAHPSVNENDDVPLLAAQGSASMGADDVLDGILQDLNIKVGQLAVDAAKGDCADTVSEYSGGSAKSVEESTVDDEGDDEEEDEEESSDEEDEDADKEKVRKRSSAVGDRVDAVVAAAEEIRMKKRGTLTPPPKDVPKISAAAEPASPATQEATQDGSNSGRDTPMTEPPQEAEISEISSKEEDNTTKKKESMKQKLTRSLRRQKSKSPVKEMFGKKIGGGSRSNSPASSPEVNTAPASSPKANAPVFSPEVNTAPVFSPPDEEEEKGSDEQSLDKRDDGTASRDGEDNTVEEDTLDDRTFDDTLEEGDSYDDNERRRGRGGGREDETLGTYEEEEGVSVIDMVSFDNPDDNGRPILNKDVIIHAPGGPSHLVVRAMYYTPLPAMPEDVVIKVEASTVSFRDCLLRRDIGPNKVKFPFVPGCEVVGHIEALGKAARQEGYRVGDRVVGLTRNGGGNGYYTKVTVDCIAPIISDKVDAADAACLVDTYMTAYQALRMGKKDGTPLTDANVLITDGYSPVGQAAVTLAKLEGANVYVTTTESRQDEHMRTMGVKCLPVAPSKWLHKLKGKMDVVIDNTCFDSYDSSWKALNVNGVLVCTGMSSIYGLHDFTTGFGGGCGCDAFGDLRDYQAKWAAMKARYIMSQTVFLDLSESLQKDPKKYAQELKYLCFLVESGTLKPKIAERVSLEEIPDAQRYLETGKVNGTIVCLP